MTTRPSSSVSNTTAISAEAYAQAIEDARMATDQSPLRPDIVCDVILRIAREISAQRPAQADALEGVRALVAKWDEITRNPVYDRSTQMGYAARRDELEAALAATEPKDTPTDPSP